MAFSRLIVSALGILLLQGCVHLRIEKRHYRSGIYLDLGMNSKNHALNPVMEDKEKHQISSPHAVHPSNDSLGTQEFHWTASTENDAAERIALLEATSLLNETKKAKETRELRHKRHRELEKPKTREYIPQTEVDLVYEGRTLRSDKINLTNWLIGLILLPLAAWPVSIATRRSHRDTSFSELGVVAMVFLTVAIIGYIFGLIGLFFFFPDLPGISTIVGYYVAWLLIAGGLWLYLYLMQVIGYQVKHKEKPDSDWKKEKMIGLSIFVLFISGLFMLALWKWYI